MTLKLTNCLWVTVSAQDDILLVLQTVRSSVGAVWTGTSQTTRRGIPRHEATRMLYFLSSFFFLGVKSTLLARQLPQEHTQIEVQ